MALQKEFLLCENTTTVQPEEVMVNSNEQLKQIHNQQPLTFFISSVVEQVRSSLGCLIGGIPVATFDSLCTNLTNTCLHG